MSVDPADPKNRLGDKLRDKQKGEEDRYFAKRERELIERLKRDQTNEQEEALGTMARMRCPKCGNRLDEEQYEGVTVDTCPSCGGVWLDKGELEHVRQRESEGWVGRFLRRSLRPGTT